MLQWVYVLLEFQATVDTFMAVRILVYVGLLYQDLTQDNKLTLDGRLPPVLVEERGYSAAFRPTVRPNSKPRSDAR
jgi:hypothetical protein